MDRVKSILLLCVLFIIILSIILFIPNVNNNYVKTKIYISEIMASNYDTVMDNYKEYSDYIEIHNSTNNKINLEGYYLSDSEFDTKKWKFPSIELDPNSYLIIYASGLDECTDNICHTNFKLSSRGEVLTLCDKEGNIISKFKYPELPNDVSYGYKDGKYMMFDTPTPGSINNSQEYKKKSKKKYNIVINEYVTNNYRINYDNHGNYYDWVELYNPSGEDLVLDSLFITDDKEDLRKFKIPKVTIEKDSYLLLYFSKEKVNYDDNIYVPFGLSINDKSIIISNGEDIIDEVEIIELPKGYSYGRVDGIFKCFSSPTPGKVNDTASFLKVGDTSGDS